MTWTTLVTTTRKIHYSISKSVERHCSARAYWPPSCFDTLYTRLLLMNCETSSAWIEIRYENNRIKIIMLFMDWLQAGENLSYQEKIPENWLSGHLQVIHLNAVVHLSGTKSMLGQSWQCATTTSPHWRTITVPWPSRSFRFPSATSLPTWILKRSKRSDRWDVKPGEFY